MGYKILMAAFLLIAVGLATWIGLPTIAPGLCKNHSPFFSLAIRGCKAGRDIPPFEGMEQRFPRGYLVAMEICESHIYSTRSRINAINALAWYAYLDIERSDCLQKVDSMRDDPELGGHAAWVMRLHQDVAPPSVVDEHVW
jgi:hypothetical protein